MWYFLASMYTGMRCDHDHDDEGLERKRTSCTIVCVNTYVYYKYEI